MVPGHVNNVARGDAVQEPEHGAGDHVLVVGLVEEFQAYGHPPLLFYRGAFEHLRTPAVRRENHGSEVYIDFPELW